MLNDIELQKKVEILTNKLKLGLFKEVVECPLLSSFVLAVVYFSVKILKRAAKRLALVFDILVFKNQSGLCQAVISNFGSSCT